MELRISSPARSSWIGRWTFVLWLVGTAVVPAAFGLTSPIIRIVALVWPVPVLLLMGGRRSFFAPVFVQQPGRVVGAALVIASASLSVVISPNPDLSLEMLISTLVAMLICAGFWAIVGRDDLSPLQTYTWVSIAVFLAALATILAPMAGRLSFAGLDPNTIGLILESVTVASLAFRRLAVRAAAVLISMYGMYLTDSRSALIGTTIALIVYLLIRPRALLVWTAILLVLATIAVTTPQDIAPATDQVSDILQLHNRDRGVNSGFTGRAQLWQEALEIWYVHPLIGSGYRAIEEYIPQTCHEGYLEILAETGLIGALCIALFFSQGVRGLVIDARAGSQVARIGLALTAGYLFVAFFERYFLNFGNPTSLLVLCMWLRPTTTAGLQRGRAPYKVTRGPIPSNSTVAYAYSHGRYTSRNSR
jgi:O-antigen ligase